MKTLLLALSFFLLEISPVQAQTPYFQGKTIRTSPVIPPAISTICGRDSSPSTTESFFAREPFNTWRKDNFVKSIAQYGDCDRQNEKVQGK